MTPSSSWLLATVVVVANALPLGLEEGQALPSAVVCDFSFVVCADPPSCCIMMMMTGQKIDALNASAFKARIEGALGCSLHGTLLSDRYLELLCDPSIAYDPDMLIMPVHVRPLAH